MKASLLLSALLMTASSAAFAADCSRPPEPGVPDGSTASQEQMIKSQQEVKQFIEETDAFTQCLAQEEATAKADADKAGKPLSGEQQNVFIDRHNAAVDSMHNVADSFNTQLRTFMDRQKQQN
jgi:hypothetical protein